MPDKPIRIASSGHIAGYDVIVANGGFIIMHGKEVLARHKPTNYGTDFAEFCQRPGFRMGWGRTADFEVIGFYDVNDDNFGYAWNITYGEGEWEYCWFQTDGEAVG